MDELVIERMNFHRIFVYDLSDVLNRIIGTNFEILSYAIQRIFLGSSSSRRLRRIVAGPHLLLRQRESPVSRNVRGTYPPPKYTVFAYLDLYCSEKRKAESERAVEEVLPKRTSRIKLSWQRNTDV